MAQDSSQVESTKLSDSELDDLVASSDTGGRNPSGITKKILLGTALIWSLFQLWIASPIPYALGFGVFNSTEARSIHLAIAVFLAFLAFPAGKKSPRDHVPMLDWGLAIVGAFCAAYLFIFYESLSERPGAPTDIDAIVAVVGMVILLLATLRALGPPLAVIAVIFLSYTFAGQYMPDLIAHKGNSLMEVVNHQWITTEGVFGIAVGVSASFVFLFVLFGALLDKAGAGNYFIKVAFSLLGHFSGGPAKAAVVASGLTGLISGSSIANVVTTGTFTIPMMKRVGFSSEKAGAVEVASSVNGQIMPPVMGAAAFLMVEYVGITYFEVITHAFLPAVISYIALVYIVHLEAKKMAMAGLPRAVEPKPWVQRVTGFLFGFIGICVIAFGTYYGLGWLKPVLGDGAAIVVAIVLAAAYIFLAKIGSSFPDLVIDDPNSPVLSLPDPHPTIRSGLHFLLPVVVLVWCLMVERLSPKLSAYWATMLMIVILLTQRPLFAMFRGETSLSAKWKQGWNELIDGLIEGARNMIGIGLATAAAGIIVGVVSQTGVGAALAAVVEAMSGGHVLVMLALTGVLSLILGMGLPTTANYIVVSTLLAPVIVELGQANGLIVPLIAVHLFVFYFGIMADVTPPVGLASFAAAAVSGGDPMKTGFIAFFYSLRTAALPFLFIYNTDLLLIDVSWAKGIFTFCIATVAMLVFAAGTQGYFFARSKIWESVALVLIAFTLFRPGFWMDMISPPYTEVSAAEINQVADGIEAGEDLRLRIAGISDIGEPMSFVALLGMGEGASGAERIASAGLQLLESGDKMIVDGTDFDSAAEKAGFDFDQEITSVMKPNDTPSRYLMFIPALLILFGIVAMQRRRGANEVITQPESV